MGSLSLAKDKLSVRQKHILEFIQICLDKHGYPPTIREIGEACDITSTSVVNHNLNRLQKMGYIARNRRVSRGIRLLGLEDDLALERDLVSVPLVGRIFASKPVPMPDAASSFAPEEAISLTRDLVGDGTDLFALEVRGDSMIDAMIGDGDVVVMKRQITARNGDLVAVWLDDSGETTLKHFFFEDGRVRLQPANPTMKPIYVKPSRVRVQGKVVLVLRQIETA